VKPVLPPAPVLAGAKPSPGAVMPVSPVRPISPVSPVSPVKPITPTGLAAATTPVAPPAPGGIPLKPASSIPAGLSEANPKTGTTIVKSAPPKETARITVKPNLPATARPAGNFPTAVKAAAVAVPAAVAAAVVAAKPSGKPATTVVKTSGVTAKTAVVKPMAKPGAVSATSAVPVAPLVYQEEGSTTLTTALAAVLALLTWGTAGVLIASYLALI
jgi:hypothetical protein